MKPKFTDAHRFPPKGYKPAVSTDIRETFERIRKQQAEQAQRKADNEREAAEKLAGAITPKRKSA